MRDQLLKAAKLHAQAHVEKHRLNVEVYLTNPAGIGEHSDMWTVFVGKVCHEQILIAVT